MPFRVIAVYTDSLELTACAQMVGAWKKILPAGPDYDVFEAGHVVKIPDDGNGGILCDYCAQGVGPLHL